VLWSRRKAAHKAVRDLTQEVVEKALLVLHQPQQRHQQQQQDWWQDHRRQ